MPTTGADTPNTPVSVRTERLCLRFHHDGDIEPLAPLIGDYEVARWLARVPYPYSAADAREFVAATRHGLNDRGELVYAVADPASDEILGAVSLIVSGPEAELGYWLGLPHQGRGYAREAVAALLELAFGPLMLDLVHADVRADNARSRQLLDTLGFEEKGRVSIYQMIGKRYVMGPRYELPRARWKEVNP